jgi:hypothetical protein
VNEAAAALADADRCVYELLLAANAALELLIAKGLAFESEAIDLRGALAQFVQ